jgi:hypothetical protein
MDIRVAGMLFATIECAPTWGTPTSPGFDSERFLSNLPQACQQASWVLDWCRWPPEK